MSIIIITVFLILCTITITTNRNKFTKRISLVFYIEWTIFLLISITNPKNLNPVSELTYFYLCVFPLMFLLGVASLKINNNYNNSFENIHFSLNNIATKKTILWIISICDIFLLTLYLKKKQTLDSLSALDYYNNGGIQNLFEGNSILGLINTFILTPMTFFANYFLAYLLLFNRKRIIPITLYSIFVILRTLIVGGRSGLLDCFIFIIFFLFCYPRLNNRKSKSLNQNTFKKLLPLCVLLLISLVGISYMTNQRINNSNEFNTKTISDGWNDTSFHLYTYTVGPFRAFDYALKNDYVNNRFNGYKFGQSTFGFIDYGIELICKNIGINYKAGNSQVYSHLQNNWINIPHNFNFAYTALFNFYVDFGFLGVIFFPYFIGLILGMLILNFNKKQNPILLIAIAYLYYVLMYSFFTWNLYNLSGLIIIIWLCILYKITPNLKSNVDKHAID